MENKSCTCGSDANKVVMACSGAADVGLISDKVARALKLSGERNMSCLALVGAGIEKSIEGFRTKDLLVIDGCPMACGKKMMEERKIENYKHLVITEQGFKKGESPATDENVKKIFDIAVANY